MMQRRGWVNMLIVALGTLAGVALVLVTLYWYPFAHLTRTERVLPSFGAGKQVETFTLRGRLDGHGDAVSITHGGKVPFAPQPRDVQLLIEPAIASGLALITRVRDPSGRTVGIAPELESGHEDSNLLAGKLLTHTTWTVVVPGRGALVLYQVEDNWTLATRIVGPALALGRPWRGTWHNLNTLGPLPQGHGEIVAATGEFAGRSGTFVEDAEMREFLPSGAMDFTMTVRVAFDAGTPPQE
jgi:hypothetical protein